MIYIVDILPMAISMISIIISSVTAFLTVSPKICLHSICTTKDKYVLLLIINNGFSPGLLYTECGLIYNKGLKRKYIKLKTTRFIPNIKINNEYMDYFWDGGFLKTISPKEAIFLVLDINDFYMKLKEIRNDKVQRTRIYITTIRRFGKRTTKKQCSYSIKVKEWLTKYENLPTIRTKDGTEIRIIDETILICTNGESYTFENNMLWGSSHSPQANSPLKNIEEAINIIAKRHGGKIS